LVAGDTNHHNDIFVHDRQTKLTTRVSVNNNGVQGNGDSDLPSISGDGRYVAFQSYATNLVPGDTNGNPDIFVRDRQLNTTVRVNVSSAGKQANDVSGSPRISADGRFVAFSSAAGNLVPNDTNFSYDVFVHDLQTKATTRVSLSNTGAEGEQGSGSNLDISGDGRYVVFESSAENLVTGDHNSRTDIFVRDRTANTTTRVSLSNTGAQANNDCYEPRITSDGRYVVFRTIASNLVTGDTNAKNDVFVRDRQSNTTTRVSVASNGGRINGDAVTPAISNDGRFVAYESNATNIVAGDTNGVHDIFVRDLKLNTTTRASLANDGIPTDNSCFAPSMSGNAQFIAFESISGNLVPNDTGGFSDVFVRDRGTPPPAAADGMEDANGGNSSDVSQDLAGEEAGFAQP
jgi:archaellum component FlaF (FlaF/FlaG flagellin family)